MTGRILIADDVPAHRIILRSCLADAAYEVRLAHESAELLRSLRADAPDLILLADPLDDQGAARLLGAIRALPGGDRVPVIVLSPDADGASRTEAVRAGADAVMARLPDSALLRARIRNLMRRSAKEAELARSDGREDALGLAAGFAEPMAAFLDRPGQIALVAETLAQGLDWRNGLSRRMRDRIAVIDPARALRDLGELPAPPDAIVIGEHMSGSDTVAQMISDLRSRAETLNSALVLTQQTPDIGRAVAALDLGVSDVVETGFDPAEMAQILRREIARKVREDSRRAALQDGLRLAHTDPLTGLYNRRSAMQHLSQVMVESQACGQSFAVMVLDLDRFKAVNDRFGHAAGDVVLTEVTARMQAALRRGDFMARLGGEEFLAVVRNCDPHAARIAAERLRQAVASAPVQLPGAAPAIDVTVSIGMVICAPDDPERSAAELIDLADRALYAAKADGRNQVTVYEKTAA